MTVAPTAASSPHSPVGLDWLSEAVLPEHVQRNMFLLFLFVFVCTVQTIHLGCIFLAYTVYPTIKLTLFPKRPVGAAPQATPFSVPFPHTSIDAKG